MSLRPIALLLLLATFAHAGPQDAAPAEQAPAKASAAPEEAEADHVEHHGLVLSGAGKAQAVSMTSDRKPEVREIKPHDLVTLQINDAYSFVKSANLTTDNKYDTKFTVNKFFNITSGADGSSQVARPTASSKPSIDLTSERKGDDKGTTGANQKIQVRLSGHVVEVYPNHTFSFEATQETEQDENRMTMTVFGIARVQDISPDNVLSGERLDSKKISVTNDGPVARMAKRGWFVKLLDIFWPF